MTTTSTAPASAPSPATAPTATTATTTVPSPGFFSRINITFPTPTGAEWLFSAKTFASGMLAMYIASRAGLPRPFWALATAYIVANPLAGAVRSKALFRFIGTLVGSTVAVLLVPALSNAPVLLTTALALWVGTCLFVSLLDRTPRAYVFMLSGYTAALIGFPSVQAPLLVFDTAVARVEEIGLAILCATVVHSIVLPTGLATSLLGLLDRTLADGRQWLYTLLKPDAPRDDSDPAAMTELRRRLDADRRRLAADMTQLRILSTHVPFDTGNLRWTAGALRTMQDRVAALTPSLSSVEDRLAALLSAEGTLAPDITAALDAVRDWLEVGEPAPGRSMADRIAARDARMPALMEAINRIGDPPAGVTSVNDPPIDETFSGDASIGEASIGEAFISDPSLAGTPIAGASIPDSSNPDTFIAHTSTADTSIARRSDGVESISARPIGDPWQAALRISLVTRLTELVENWRACAALRSEIDDGITGRALRGRTVALGNRVLHRDYGMAALSGLAAIIAIAICSTFWIATGWSSGSVAAMLSAVFCSFFATMDDPVPAIHSFLKWTLLSFPPSAIYVLVLLPVVHDFGMLVLVCAPVFLIAGAYIARPATVGQALAFTIGVAGTLALHDTGSADLTSFVNTNLAQVVGLVAAARVTRLVRSVGADWSARRIQRAIWRELGDIAASPNAPAGDGYAVRMLDRIGLLAPRIAQSAGNADATVANDALRDLRVGVDIAMLQGARTQLPADLSSRVLGALAVLFRGRASGRPTTVPDGLLGDIDAALTAALTAAPRATADSAAARAAVTALVGLRRNIFPDAPVTLGAAT